MFVWKRKVKKKNLVMPWEMCEKTRNLYDDSDWNQDPAEYYHNPCCGWFLAWRATNWLFARKLKGQQNICNHNSVNFDWLIKLSMGCMHGILYSKML